MIKTLIASGCSFTFEEWNWPTHVANEFNLNLINVGMGSQGNGLIAKKAMYAVDNYLKTNDPESLWVGIMWSGVDRNDFYIDNIYNQIPNEIGWIENPTGILEGSENKKWVITNHGWKIPWAENWYKNFHSDVGSMVQTIQNILLTQWFLDRHNIKYFMTTYMNIFDKNLIVHPEVKYLYKMIDFTKFLPVGGCHEWVKANHPIEGFEIATPTISEFHPTEFGHEQFAKKIIAPFILQNIK
jgi:hypothetical protein